MMKEEVSCKTLEDVSLDEVTITPEEYNNILDIQQTILDMIASRDSCTDILAHLCTLAESLLPNSVASIMLVDKSTGLMSVLSAPSVPQVGHDALANLQPGLGGGSCGNAVFHNQTPSFAIQSKLVFELLKQKKFKLSSDKETLIIEIFFSLLIPSLAF